MDLNLSSPAYSRISKNGARYYKIEGFNDLFPSVTTVLNVISKPGLIPWAKRTALESVKAALDRRVGGAMWVTSELIEEILSEANSHPDQVKSDAADFGTQAHDLIHKIILGGDPPIPSDMEPVISNFLTWRRDAGLDFRLAEMMVFSAKHRYAGAVDALAYRDSQLIAVDWKTANGVYSEHALQLAAYARAMEEMSGHPITEAWVVRLGKNRPEFEVRKVSNLDQSFTAFRAALHLWKSLKLDLL